MTEIDQFGEFLEDISRCFIQRDLELWRRRLILPFSIITRLGPVSLCTEQAVAENFQHYLMACEAMQLDLIDRRIVGLQDCEDGTWLGTFQTRLVRKEILVVRPYTATSLLQQFDGEFRMSSMLNGRGHTEWTGVTDR